MFYDYMQGIFRDLASVRPKERYEYNIKDRTAEAERWAAVHGGYFISTHGRVSGLKGQILKQYTNRDGYKIVCIRRKPHRVHRLVAGAFIPNPDNKPIVNHIDGDRSNNNIDNLEWATARENNMHGIYVSPVGNRPRCKVKCMETGKEYPSISEAARQNGFDRNRFQANIHYNNTYGGLHWMVTRE